MKFFFVFAFSAVPLLVSATPITSDPVYDNATESLGAVACSDGPNGMLTKGYNVFGDLKTFPYIGGSSAVAAWNSPNCGSPGFPEFDFVTAAYRSPLPQVLAGMLHTGTRPSP